MPSSLGVIEPEKFAELPLSLDTTMSNIDKPVVAQAPTSIQPSTEVELALAAEYRDTLEHCDKLFADPNFDIPMLADAAMRVINLVQDPNVMPRKIAMALQSDAVLTAKFLRLANSPFYAGTRKVDSVQIAVDRLGMMTVKNVVLTVSLSTTILTAKRLGSFATGIWQHAGDAALAAQALAARARLPQAQVYTLGLMHDIGKLPAWLILNKLATKYPGVRPAILENLVEEVHERVGRSLMSTWNMPSDVCVVVAGHHSISTLGDATQHIIQSWPDKPLSECTALAELLSCTVLADRALAVLGISGESGNLDISEAGLGGELGLSDSVLKEYLDQLPKFLEDNKFKEI